MPTSKPMKIQWLNINNRQVPMVLPQIWDEDLQDWVVTSENNPLPTIDNDLSSRLDSIENKLDSVIEDGSVNTQLTGSNVGYSNETKPAGKKGETFLELDTLDVYIHDGSEWVMI